MRCWNCRDEHRRHYEHGFESKKSEATAPKQQLGMSLLVIYESIRPIWKENQAAIEESVQNNFPGEKCKILEVRERAKNTFDLPTGPSHRNILNAIREKERLQMKSYSPVVTRDGIYMLQD